MSIENRFRICWHDNQVGSSAAVAAGIVLRLADLALVRYRITGSDASDYDLLGWNLAKHHCLSLGAAAPLSPSVARPPGLPVELAIVYSLFGHHILIAQLLQCAISVLAGVLLYKALSRWDSRIATIVLWVFMLSPFEALYAGELLEECLATLFLVCALALPLVLNGGRWISCGIALGLLCLTRDVYLFMIPMLAIAVALGYPHRMKTRRRLASSLLIVIVSLGVILPWSWRNYEVTHSFVLVTKGLFGFNLWVGTWERSAAWQLRGIGHLPSEAFWSPQEEAELAPIVAKNELTNPVYLKLALAHIRSAPLPVASRALLRSWRLWVGTRSDLFEFRPAFLVRGRPAWWLFKAALFSANAALLGLGVLGLCIALRERSRLLWFAIPIAYTVLIYVPFHIEIRYSQPVLFCVSIFAAQGFVRLLPVAGKVGQRDHHSLESIGSHRAVPPGRRRNAYVP